MDFDFSPKVLDLRSKVSKFMDEYVYPNEQTFEDQLNAGPDRWQIPPILEELKEQAKAAGLWNLFLPVHFCVTLRYIVMLRTHNCVAGVG